jgi:hypothetical protein
MSPDIRTLSDQDLSEAVRLLTEGFPRRNEEYWRVGLARLARREPPEHTVPVGYGLFEGDRMHGVVLAIPSLHAHPRGNQTFVNISSWYVEPSHRGALAKQLYDHASSRHPDVTYTNLSAAAHTQKAIRKMGFQEWTEGQMLGVGTRSTPGRKRVVPAREARSAGLPDSVAQTLVDHEEAGCIAFCLETPEKLAPFVFLRRRVMRLPCAQLIYCESLDDLVENGRKLSATLALRGYPAMIVDAAGPIPGLRGRYFAGKASKYIRGPAPLLHVDHTYSEMIFLGF